MPPGQVAMVIELQSGSQIDPIELEQSSQDLLGELSGLDEVKSADLLSTGKAPEGSKALDALAIGALVVKFLGTGDIANKLLGVFQAWLRQGSDHSVRLKIGPDELELKGYSLGDQKQLIDEFLKRHSR